MSKAMRKREHLCLDHVAPPAQPFVAWLAARANDQRTVLVVTDGVKQQESVFQDLCSYSQFGSNGVTKTQAPKKKSSKKKKDAELQPAVESIPVPVNDDVLLFSGWEVMPNEDRHPHTDVLAERMESLVRLSDAALGKTTFPSVIVTTIQALLQKTFAPKNLKDRIRLISRGDHMDPLDLVEWLEDQGYEPEAQVSQKGEIALRGGIVDVFPVNSPWPVRCEFFGDEVESLRYFDPANQMSREEIEIVEIPPAAELSLLKRLLPKDKDAVIADGSISSILEHLPKGAALVLMEPDELQKKATEYLSHLDGPHPLLIDFEDCHTALHDGRFAVVELLSENAGVLDGIQTDAPVTFQFESLDAFRPMAERTPEPIIAEQQRKEFYAQMHRWVRQGIKVHVFCANDGERQRFTELWADYGLPKFKKKGEQPLELPTLHEGSIARGFIQQGSNIAIVTDSELFGRIKIQRPRRLKLAQASAVRSVNDINFTELEEGDVVVHLQYGIGQFVKLEVMPATAVDWNDTGIVPPEAGQECMVIEYAPKKAGESRPRLYVPVAHSHLVSKYIGAGKLSPTLSKLGGARWNKTRKEAEQAVKDLAGEFLAIQAAREIQPGFAFQKDGHWQKEFEDAFPYEETPDQIRAIEEAKTDMEEPKPMDRLVCGDVGFGKTEIAIRAAFKAVMEGKQVAFLCPTTVLAQQHFNTFRERMGSYPVRIELLSRFRTRRQQDLVLRDLKLGTVDIVIGTHRLIQPDVDFKDLGMVVIDEEQRFGVAHKERFKRVRRMIDVITLSATPIPRTLYMALTGARDLSTIETPPQDRLPVETIVTEYDERLIRKVIQRELNREGQVFFLHNRVNTIYSMQKKLLQLLPDARILVGHGQMPAHDLEEVMTKFINHEADVLLSTTIIESGIDIPNANTIIIDRADRFGLSELYQLRGRVGRYRHQAYAYMFVPRQAKMQTDSRKRMNAIKQFSSLGSGFKIAMRDLEIRGAGNLLGAEQSGHITAVGFELYCQLLKQSVAALKGEKIKPRVSVTLRIDFLAMSPGEMPLKGEKVLSVTHPAYVPFKYIEEAPQRIDVYRRLAQITETKELKPLAAELKDRYGKLPLGIELLFETMKLKILASNRRISVIETRGQKLMLTRKGDYIMRNGKFPRLAKTEPKARLSEIRNMIMVYPPEEI
ncbi:transcription-repair coupling factor [Verrucomicrobia bacterium]|nr:transcription-repair coupling factor [Verrucomicrobiota bacterium]